MLLPRANAKSGSSLPHPADSMDKAISDSAADTAKNLTGDLASLDANVRVFKVQS